MHWPEALRVVPSERYPDLYLLCVKYHNCADEQFIRAVHVPAALRSALEDAPEGFHLEMLSVESEASLLLSGSPMYAVIAVVDRYCAKQIHIPQAWRGARRRALLVAFLATAAAVGLGIGGFGRFVATGAWLASCVAFKQWHRAANLRFKPMHVFLEVGS